MHLLRKLRRGPAVLACVLLPFLTAHGVAQSDGETDLERLIRQQDANNVKGYVQPIADLFGANMNAGFIRNANIPRMGFNIRLDIIAMAAFVKSDQENYQAQDPWGGKFTTATIFGKKGQYSFNPLAPGDSSQAYRGSDGLFSTTIFPFAAPQLTIGHIYGTEAVIRYVPIPKISSLPAITLLGIGVRHSVSQYIEALPLDLAAGFMYNRFTVGDLITVSGHAFTLQASKELAILVLYGGVQFEKSTLKLTYSSTAGQNVDVELEGSNVVRGVIGAGLNLGFLKLFADANFGAVTSVSGGIGFGF